MKATITVLVLMTMTHSVFAKIPQGCVRHMQEVVKETLSFKARAPELVNQGELTQESADSIAESWTTVAETSALLCAGLRRIELQNSIPGRLGLISYKKAQAEADKSYSEAMDYYNREVNK